jgi:hypothetical protein
MKVVAFPLTANISHLPEKRGKQNPFLLHPTDRQRLSTAKEESP